MARAVVSVRFPDTAINSVRVEQWVRGKKGEADREPRIITGATQVATLVGPREWATREFILRGAGTNNKLHLRVVGYSGNNGNGTRLAVIAVPPRRHPKP